MFTTLSRIIKYGLNGFWRNGWLSTAATAILFLVLVGFGGLLIFNSLTNIIISDIQDKIDISAYFRIDAPEDSILQIQRALEGMPEVKKVDYISREDALEIFKQKNENNEIVSQALNELDINPLSASLDIKARELSDYATVASFLEKDDYNGLIENVSYAQNQTVIERLKKIKNIVEQGGLLLIIFISLVTGLIIFNTIRLTIYSNRDELRIMRLVGASNFFIRGPYLLEGLLYGMIGSILSLGIITLLIYYSGPYTASLASVNAWGYYTSNLFKFFTLQLLFGVGLGILSSYVAVRKYLRI